MKQKKYQRKRRDDFDVNRFRSLLWHALHQRLRSAFDNVQQASGAVAMPSPEEEMKSPSAWERRG